MLMDNLLATARAARARAYVPYSGFAVGAALLAADGSVFTGANIENASFGLTVCAERTAVWSAVHTSRNSKFDCIAVVADCSPPPLPCGACRQVMWEMLGDVEVVMGNLQGEVARLRLSRLLPQPFGSDGWSLPKELAIDKQAQSWRLPLTVRPIGYVQNEFHASSDISADYKELLSRLVINPELEDGLFRLEEEKNIAVIGYLHQAEGYALKEKRSGRGGEIYGVFACRAPRRPNAISHSEVELLGRQGATLTVKGLDLLNQTPILDIKTILHADKPG